MVVDNASDANHWLMQLSAVVACQLLCANSAAGTAAAFAGTTARPAALLPWLAHTAPVFGWLVTSARAAGAHTLMSPPNVHAKPMPLE